jgi:hypothetical protein
VTDDGVINQLVKYGDFDENEAWDVLKSNYLRKTPEQRIIDLKACDSFIDVHTAEHTGVTKELGSLLTRKRELESIHRRLRELNR